MRIRLLVEGTPTTDGRLIQHDAVRWDDDPVPVVLRGANYSQVIVGSISHVQREPDGSITGVTDVEETVTVSLVEVVTEDDAARRMFVCTSGRLSGAVVTSAASWPWPDFPQRGKTPNVCPECEQGKHGNCDGSAWDDEADEYTACECVEEF